MIVNIRPSEDEIVTIVMVDNEGPLGKDRLHNVSRLLRNDPYGKIIYSGGVDGS